MRRIFLFITLFTFLSVFAADPTATTYTFDECAGSLRPYPAPENSPELPEGYEAVMINHVGRHGSRYPSSPNNTYNLLRALLAADSLHTITPKGKRLLELTSYVADVAHNYWGALDSLGMAEQRAIASRMFVNFPTAFAEGNLFAASSYSPRCMASMYEFTHQLDRLNNKIEFATTSGRANSSVLRPFDDNAAYTEYISSKVWETPYNDYAVTQITAAPLRRVLGDKYPLSKSETSSLAMSEYYFVAGLRAMGLNVSLEEFFTIEEANALWSCFNLRQYLQRTATTLSSVPAEIASPLLLDIIRSTDDFIAGRSAESVILRFAHAETLLPLYSLLRLRGGYYLTNYFDTVKQHFRDFELVPMAANIQFILFADADNHAYLRVDVNEQPIPLLPNDDRLYLPWSEARNYLVKCLPLIYQP